ncbi:MAG: hypothetical protein GY822_16880 [Deltaproteobacteria bacterium]|nr:hypothetical protein [Deltaproteobacteria bacterium]
MSDPKSHKPDSQRANANPDTAAQWAVQKKTKPSGLPAQTNENLRAANNNCESDDNPGMAAIVDVSTVNNSFVLTRIGDLAGWAEVLLENLQRNKQKPNVRDPSHTQFEISLSSLATVSGN